MDPQTTWQTLLEAVACQNWPGARNAAEALLAWLNHRGCPPVTMATRALPATWHRAVARAACRFALSAAAREQPRSSSPARRPSRVASDNGDGLGARREMIERLENSLQALASAVRDLTNEVQWLNHQQPFEIGLPAPSQTGAAHDASAEN